MSSRRFRFPGYLQVALALTLALAATAGIFWVQGEVWYRLRTDERRASFWALPRWRAIDPTPRGGIVAECRGLRFRLPWADAAQYRPCGFRAQSGRLVYVRDPPVWLESLKRSDVPMHEAYRSFLAMTPAPLSPFMDPDDAVQLHFDLTTKAALLPMHSDSGLYAFRVGRFIGFQGGDPKRARGIDIVLFDDQGYRGGLWILGEPNLTWREVDFILGSLE